jgi:hypothetical protein
LVTPLKESYFLLDLHVDIQLRTLQKVPLIFIASIQEFQRDVAKSQFEILIPHFLSTAFSQQPIGRSHKCIFSLMPFVFAKGNTVIK